MLSKSTYSDNTKLLIITGFYVSDT